MAKPPPNIPPLKIGEPVVLRANTKRTGEITAVSEQRMWCDVSWNDGGRAPKIVHQYELMTPPIDGSSKSVV